MRYNPHKHHLVPFTGEGILLVDKPATWTSFDVVNFVRSRFNVPKVGHCGTLDPAATGLLVLVLGRYTRVSSAFSGENKTYQAVVKIGVATDTFDLDGEVISTCDTANISDDALRDAVLSFKGESEQLPPMYSAVRVGGKKLYELARKGETVEREARKINISRIEIVRCEVPECEFILDCSKGTYVRTLCDDIGKKLKCGGVMKSLRRLRSGEFSLDKALTVDRLKEMDQAQLNEQLLTADLELLKGSML